MELKVKILITNGHLQVGGVEKSLVNLLNAIDYSKNEVDLILFEGAGEYRNLIPKNVKVIEWDLTSTYGSLIKVLKKAIKNKDFKLAFTKIIITLANKVNLNFLRFFRLYQISNKFYDCAIAYRVGMPAEFVSFIAKANKKLVWWHHGEAGFDVKTVDRWLKTFARMDYIVCVSNYTKVMMEPYFYKMKDKMIVIPNMINIEEIRSKAIEFQPYLPSDRKKTILVSVGRFSPEKHMKDCVIVGKRLLEQGYKNYIWYLVGDGAERSEIESLLKRYNLNNYFKLIGSKQNPYPYINYADIYVHPSYVESQGLAVIEAFVLGKLSVIVNSGGTAEFVEDKINAFVAQRNVYSLTENVIKAIELENKQLFQKSCQKCSEQFSDKVILKRVYDVIEREN